MKYSDLSALAIKIAGLVLLVLVLTKVPESFKSFRSLQNAQASTLVIYYVAPLVIVAIASIIFILFPYKITDKLVVKITDAPSDSIVSQIQEIGIRLLGLLLLFWVTSDLVYLFFIYFIFRDMADASYGAVAYDFPALFATIAEFIFALILLTRSRAINNYINKMAK